jgi:hypothetical protein
MNANTQTAPRRRGRPRKSVAEINPQFPGVVISITSVPRLRVGCICEIRASRFPQNIGQRVEIVEFYPDGDVGVRARAHALMTADMETGVPSGEHWEFRVNPDQLYRIGHR